MPDAGPILLLTRPRAASERFAAAVTARLSRPVQIVIAPVIEIVGIGAPVKTGHWPTLIFTSANAVSRVEPSQGKPAFCVGEQTTAVAAAAGFAATNADGAAEDLLDLLLSRRPRAPLLHPRGAQGVSLAAKLSEHGIPTEECIVYRQEEQEIPSAIIDRLCSADRVIAPVFSPRSAARLRACLDHRVVPDIIAISDAAALAWGGTATVADAPNGAAMLDAVESMLDSDSPYRG